MAPPAGASCRLAERLPVAFPVGKQCSVTDYQSRSDARKVALARLLWERTTVRQGWIADKLGMGSAANVSQQIRRDKAAQKRQKLPQSLKAFLNSVKI